MPKTAPRGTVMTSVDRALSLLGHFSTDRPEIGLSALARAAGFDKTTTLRCLNALERNGFVEQHPETRKYRLGVAPLHLARVRERSFPVQTLLQPVLDRIAETVQETAHASILTHRQLVTVAVSEPNRATRVNVDPSEPLPFHATASGLAVLAALPAGEREALLAETDLKAFTADTPLALDTVRAEVARAEADGICRSRGTYEDDVVGTAVPIYGWSGAPVGAVAIAAVASRYDMDLAGRIDAAVRRAGEEISQFMGQEQAQTLAPALA